MYSLLEEALSHSLTQWVALISGIVYVILAARERSLCWLFGIVSSICIAWDDFLSFQLYADGILQVIYVVLGVIGLYRWKFGGREDSKLQISEHPVRQHIVAVAASVLLSLPIAYLLLTYTDASFGYVDVLTTILSLYATWLLINKILSNWLYWIVIDAVYVYLFYNTGGLLVAMLYAVYFVVAIYGYAIWYAKNRSPRVGSYRDAV